MQQVLGRPIAIGDKEQIAYLKWHKETEADTDNRMETKRFTRGKVDFPCIGCGQDNRVLRGDVFQKEIQCKCGFNYYIDFNKKTVTFLPETWDQFFEMRNNENLR